MAQDTSPKNTELPTGRRMEELRKEGAVHMSSEVSKVCSIMAAFLVLQLVWQQLVAGIESVMRRSFGAIAEPEPLSPVALQSGLLAVLRELLVPMLILVVVVAVIASLSVMLQTNWCIRKKLLKLQFSQLNVLNGVKRILSPLNMMHTLTAIVKLLIILPIGYHALKSYAPEMIMLIHLTVNDVMRYLGICCSSCSEDHVMLIARALRLFF